MVPSSMMFKAASALTAVGIVLVLANWYTKPEAALAWAVALVMLVVMAAALRWSQRGLRRLTGEATADRSLESVTTAVVFAALMMGIPLALTLARTYGLVDGDDVARRSIGVLTGLYLAMIGNVMPKNLPPLSHCDGARQQAFHRRAGWTWVLCGLGSAIGWLALSTDTATIATVVLVVTGLALSIVHLVHLARRARANPPVN